LHTTYTCDNMTPRQVSWFSDFVQTFCNLETLFPQVVHHVTVTRCSTFHMRSWIRSQCTPNIMYIIFWITKLYYLYSCSSILKCAKKSIKRKN
jgi:hypothetical protein